MPPEEGGHQFGVGQKLPGQVATSRSHHQSTHPRRPFDPNRLYYRWCRCPSSPTFRSISRHGALGEQPTPARLPAAAARARGRCRRQHADSAHAAARRELPLGEHQHLHPRGAAEGPAGVLRGNARPVARPRPSHAPSAGALTTRPAHAPARAPSSPPLPLAAAPAGAAAPGVPRAPAEAAAHAGARGRGGAGHPARQRRGRDL